MDSTVIAARSDLQAIAAWLARFAETQTTFDNYRKEAERLLLWSTVELRKPLSPLTHEDLLGYQRFLADPQPAGRWVFPKGRKPSRADAAWRPLLTIAGKPKPLTRSALHGIIKRGLEVAAERVALREEDAAHQVERLRRASAHWLRHTAGSRMADAQMDLRHVRDNLGHESLTTTSIYLHSPDDARHRETEQKHRLDW